MVNFDLENHVLYYYVIIPIVAFLWDFFHCFEDSFKPSQAPTSCLYEYYRCRGQGQPPTKASHLGMEIMPSLKQSWPKGLDFPHNHLN